ncbi:MAG: hypothetical protein ACREJX_09425, partial [Polyangiaceae bacterium]
MRRLGLAAAVPLTSLLFLATSAHAQAAPPPSPAPAPQPSAAPTWTTSPTSTSGSDLLPPDATTSAPAPVAQDAALEARLADLEARVKADEEKMSHEEHGSWLERHFKVSGYLQPQLILQVFNAAASPNNQPALPPGIGSNDTTATTAGTTTNKDFFRLRRARLKTELMPNEYTKLVFEIDPNLAGGASAGSGTI